jgi:DNA relaxase NicK
MKTCIDWLRFRTKSGPFEVFEALRECFGTVGEMLEFKTGVKPMDGWTFAGEISIPDYTLGRIDYGGDSQHDWVRVNITGEGCGWVQDWSAVQNLENVLREAQIRRLDIQLTTGKGEVTDAMVVAAHAAGQFSSGPGRPPEMKSLVSSNPTAGKTRYIGSRNSFKMLRCYEKGWELFKDLPDHAEFLKRVGTMVKFDNLGDCKVEDVYRVELELKAVDKDIPWDAILNRDGVFATSYPFCASLLPNAPHFVIYELPTFKPKAALLKALGNASKSYGGAFKAAHIAYGGDDRAALAVMHLVMSQEPSRRLIDAGVLTVDHAVPF